MVPNNKKKKIFTYVGEIVTINSKKIKRNNVFILHY